MLSVKSGVTSVVGRSVLSGRCAVPVLALLLQEGMRTPPETRCDSVLGYIDLLSRAVAPWTKVSPDYVVLYVNIEQRPQECKGLVVCVVAVPWPLGGPNARDMR